MTGQTQQLSHEDNFVVEAKNILAGCLFIPAETIPDSADIGSLGELDSLTFELIVLEIEKHIGRQVDPIALLEMQSVADLAELLRKEKA
ncbi:acyl carrier protein [Brucella intermedia]|uniref:acyl carrier protein n=1 Tax=Brucella intermedia TaxID=94625 RepID=UPI00124CCE2D|nr:acyl carrier protein [Brucella intermedia]KAB2672665.1 acyl carrier protein [Ochrobactrum sp. LMG 5442]KAB2719962.1 acyl carrier protein [Brucella intermedia]